MADTTLRAAVIGAGCYAAANHIPYLATRSEVALGGWLTPSDGLGLTPQILEGILA